MSMVFFLMQVQQSFAQELAKNKTLHYTPKQGLSFGIVNSITQDNKGFMWFATGDGLNRFDGTTFKVFKFDPNNKASLSSNFVQKVFKDQQGTIWVSSRKGLSRFDPRKEQFQTYRFTAKDEEDDVSNISAAQNGNLWISSSANGFYNFDITTLRYTHYHQGNLPRLKENSILSVLEDSFGWVWVGTKDSGVQLFKPSSGKRLEEITFAIPMPSTNRINGLFEDSYANVWIAASNGLLFFKRNENRVYALDPLPTPNPYLSIQENGNKELLLGVQNLGVYKFDLTTSMHMHPDKFSFKALGCDADCGISEQSVQSLFLDRDGNSWLGTYGDGVYMLSSVPERFSHFQQKRGKNSGGQYVSYYGMTLDEQGNLWLGTDGDGIYKTTRDGKVLKHYTADGKTGSLPGNAILAAFRDKNNDLWFGSYSNGLFKYNKRTDSFRQYSSNPSSNQALHSNDIRVIYQDRNDHLWVGTNGGGLSLFDPKKELFTSVTHADYPIMNDVRALIDDQKGNLWIGSYGGGLHYYEVEKGKFHRMLETNKGTKLLSNNVVFSLFLDKQHLLWIGTEGDGLIRYDTQSGQTQVFNETNGLANSTIYAIQADEAGMLWLSTNKGISKLDPSSGLIHNFDGSDGLQAGKFNERSLIYDASKQFMVFGGTQGWNLFYPKNVQALSTFKPEVLITGLQLFGKGTSQNGNWNPLDKDLSEREEITLKPNQSFSIHYVALNYPFPKEGSFAYKLDGLDKDWIYVNDQTLATYRYLGPGSYTFMVKASNQDQVWSNEVKSIRITILPPWYKTWWAYMLYACLILFTWRSYVQYKQKQRRMAYKLKLSELNTLKEKELHQRKLSFFTNISHEFRTPLTLIINPVKDMLYAQGGDNSQGTMAMVYRNAKRLLSLVDQLLLIGKDADKADALRVRKINFTELCEEVFLCFTNQAKVKNIQYDLQQDSPEIALYGDRDKLEIALYNLIANAFKFTPKFGTIRMELQKQHEGVFVRISDTGIGIPSDIGEKLFDRFFQFRQAEQKNTGGFGIGLYLVKSIIDSHSGTITYRSELGKGTCFELELRSGNSHFQPHVIMSEEPQSPNYPQGGLSDQEVAMNSKPVLHYPEIHHALSSNRKSLLLIDDHQDIRTYIKGMFMQEFDVLEADNGQDGWLLIKKHQPDLVISDVMMPGLNGIDLCSRLKEDEELKHIPIILLTASASAEIKLKGLECGADDYISKPFDRSLVYARVIGILKTRNNLQQYFFNEVTLKPNSVKISEEDKLFLDHCMALVEKELQNPDFGIKDLMEDLYMSRSSLYSKVKSLSGQSPNEFIRFIRLRKAAQLLLSTDYTIYETAEKVGINDLKYFREQFRKVFHMNPSQYVKKFRKSFHETYKLNTEIVDLGNK